MKLLLIAAASLLAAPCAQAQVLGPGPGAGQTGGQPAGVTSSGAGVFGGQVGTPLGTPSTAPGVNIGVTADAAVNGPPEVSADAARGAVNTTLQPTPLDARAAAKGAVDDSRTLNSGQASADASARVADGQLAAGLSVRGNDGQFLGRISRVVRNRSGQVSSVVVQSADGVSRSMPSSGLTVSGGAVVTTRGQAEFNGLPRIR